MDWREELPRLRYMCEKGIRHVDNLADTPCGYADEEIEINEIRTCALEIYWCASAMLAGHYGERYREELENE